MAEDDISDVWVVVPVFNEASTIARVLAELKRHFVNVLCVDDGSSDRSPDLARGAGAVVVRHAVNLGQGAALQTGFDYVVRRQASWVITFDADGQHRVSDALRMLHTARTRNLDVVLASRFLGTSEDMPATRRALLRAAIRYSRWSSGLALTDTHNGLRVLGSKALHRIKLTQPRMAYASELEGSISRLGLKYAEEPVTVVYSEYSISKGQTNSNAINILLDLAMARLRTPT